MNLINLKNSGKMVENFLENISERITEFILKKSGKICQKIQIFFLEKIDKEKFHKILIKMQNIFPIIFLKTLWRNVENIY